jgi:hypothetical protein
MIISDLTSWLSDTGTQIVTINLLDSQDSNKYFCAQLTVEPHGKYFTVKNAFTKTTGSIEEQQSFSYSVTGRTNNGIFVLQTVNWEGGSGYFYDILFVRIREGIGLSKTANDTLTLNQKWLLIEKLGAITLGDRVMVDVTIDENSVLINAKESLPPHNKHEWRVDLN